jgi:murein DD-endopeptidase MepM/ murein hydrolase activator NlpD/phage protein D
LTVFKKHGKIFISGKIMIDIESLVPACIIYVDGTRLNTVCERAFRSVRVYDTLNRIGECAVDFDYGDLGKENSKTFSFDSEFSVHLGYKDDMNEVFNGEITDVGISLPEFGASRYKVKASSRLQRLNHGVRNRVFENKTPSQAIKDILSRYDLQADCDSFGVEKAHWRSPEQTDMELVLWLARQYGKDVHAFGNKAYVKERMTRKRDEIIYEWGKSLIDFRAVESIKNQPGSVRVIGWNAMKAEGFSAKKALKDVSQKVGGGSDWTKLSKSGAQWVHNIYDMDVSDSREAEELALGKLRETGFQYLRAEGSVEGNSKLSAGMEVTVKYVGKAHSGDYIAESVTHDFSLENGYITEFRLKRNMLDDEFVRKASGGGGHLADEIRQIMTNSIQNRSGVDANFFKIGQDVSGSEFTDTIRTDNNDVYSDERTSGDSTPEASVPIEAEPVLPVVWINPANGPITSGYGQRPHPRTGVPQHHMSIDINVPQGTPILAAASGTVVIGTTPTFGQFVALNPESTELNPNGSLRIITSHMSRVDVQNGARVEAGSVIGLSGGTPGTAGAGETTGPHVDLMVRTDGQNTPAMAGRENQLTINPTVIFNYSDGGLE